MATYPPHPTAAGGIAAFNGGNLTFLAIAWLGYRKANHDMKPSSVSVIIPCLNCQGTIAETLASVAA